MKQHKIIQAYKTIESIRNSNTEYPVPYSLALFRVKKALQDQWDFQVEQEQALFEKYEPTVDKDGSLRFKNADDEREFINRIDEISDMDIEIKAEKPKVKVADNFTIKLGDLEVLSEFIDFVE